MKYCRSLALCVILALSTLTTAWATPPSLQPIPGITFPTEVQPGHVCSFTLRYIQHEGDAPTTLKMVVETPSGPATAQPPTTEGNDPATGVTVTWTFTPVNIGSYRYHFEAVSSTGGTARYPESASQEMELTSYSLGLKYLILAIGLLIAMAFVPFVVYTGTRAVNKRGNPAAAARVGLLIGVLASYGLFLYLFNTIYSPLAMVLAGVGALAVLIALFTRR